MDEQITHEIDEIYATYVKSRDVYEFKERLSRANDRIHRQILELRKEQRNLGGIVGRPVPRKMEIEKEIGALHASDDKLRRWLAKNQKRHLDCLKQAMDPADEDTLQVYYVAKEVYDKKLQDDKRRMDFHRRVIAPVLRRYPSRVEEEEE